MEPIWQTVIAVVSALFASSGFWAYMIARRDKKNKRDDQRDAQRAMIMGLGHDRIISLCEKYIDRGWISSEEYENLNEWLFDPYTKMGGNGTAKRLMAIVDNLPTKKVEYTAEGKRVEVDDHKKGKDYK